MYYIGWDVHKNKISGATLNSKGAILNESEFEHSFQGAKSYLEGYPPEHTHIAMESSSQIYKLYDYLIKNKYDVKVAHAKEMHRITKSSKKHDRRDALILAKHLLADDIPESYIPSKEARNKRAIVRARIGFVQERTRFKNKVQSILQQNGYSIKGESFTKKWLEKFSKLEFEEETKHQLGLYVNQVKELSKLVEKYNEKIAKFAKGNKDVKILSSIPGIAELTSSVILTELDNYNRFNHYKQVASYVGIIPTTKASGEKRFHGRLTKDGNKYIKWALIQGAGSAGKTKTQIGRYFRRKLVKKGYQKACVATAHKMLRVVFSLLKKQEMYSDSLVEKSG
tara:strand:+ start:68 stop:1084 length:1017 start_codon:yes stop_codon:yes gene_type:complete